MARRNPFDELPPASRALLERLLADSEHSPDRSAVLNALRLLATGDRPDQDDAARREALRASIAASEASIAHGRCRPADEVIARLRAQLRREPRDE